MSTTPINQLQNMVGQVIPAVGGFIKQLWPAKSGVKNGKPWHVQSGLIQDNTGSIQFTLFSLPPNPFKVGDFVTLSSKLGKGGLAGCKVEQSEYNGKTETKLSVQKWGKIEVGNITQVSSPAVIEQPHSDVISTTATSATFIGGTSVNLSSYRRLYNECLIEANDALTNSPLHNFNPEDLRQVATTFFIQAIKDGVLKITSEPLFSGINPDMKDKLHLERKINKEFAMAANDVADDNCPY